MNIRLHAISVYRAKATRTSIKQQQLTLPITPFGISAYAFTDNLSRNSHRLVNSIGLAPDCGALGRRFEPTSPGPDRTNTQSLKITEENVLSL